MAHGSTIGDRKNMNPPKGGGMLKSRIVYQEDHSHGVCERYDGSEPLLSSTDNLEKYIERHGFRGTYRWDIKIHRGTPGLDKGFKKYMYINLDQAKYVEMQAIKEDDAG